MPAISDEKSGGLVGLVDPENAIFNHIWLVVRNMNFMTFHRLGRIIPTDELIFFERGRYTTNQ